MRGFFDLGGWKTQAHANVPLRLHRALQSRVEAPSFKPLQKREGFFDFGQPAPSFQLNPVFPKTILIKVISLVL